MYEFDPRYGQSGMGVWGWVAPAVGIPATAYALYRARQAQQRQEPSRATGTIEGALAAQCRARTGAACSSQQIGDICNNLSYDLLTNQHWNECRPHISAARLCGMSDNAHCSNDQVAMFCDIRPPNRQPRDCGAYVSAYRAQQQAIAQMQQQDTQIGRLQPYVGEKSGHHTGVVTGGGMRGLGWTRIEDRPTCDEVPSGQQFCFRAQTVDGNPPEQIFAQNQGCLPLRTGARCETSSENEGLKWCCPPGWPREPGSEPLHPGQFPPSPPGVMNKIKFWGQYWWFWALVAGVPAVAYLGYRYLEDEGYIGQVDEPFDIESIQIGAY